MVKPAYLIPLTKEHLACLGELVVILGQIEEEMMLAVSGLIEADRHCTELVMGSTKMANKSAIWAALIKLRKPDDPELHGWVDYAVSALSDLSAGRNDFVHANWHHLVNVGTINEAGEHIPLTTMAMRLLGTAQPSENPRGLARRIQNFQKSRTGEDLKSVRDKAAEVSCVFAHITYCVAMPNSDDPNKSPWSERLPQRPEPRPAKGEAHKAKGRGGPRQS